MNITAPPPPVPEETPAEEEPFELPTLEEVARATGTLRPETLGTHVELRAGTDAINTTLQVRSQC